MIAVLYQSQHLVTGTIVKGTISIDIFSTVLHPSLKAEHDGIKGTP